MLRKVVEYELFEGFWEGNANVMVLHFQYANDMLILSNNSQDQIRPLRRVLCCFEIAMGLRMNFAKSLIIGVGEMRNGLSVLN